MADHKNEQPQRNTVSGPMTPASIASCKKSQTPGCPVKAVSAQKDVITVDSGTPHLESRYAPSVQKPVYSSDVNVLSVIETNKEIICCKYTERLHEIAAGFSDGIVRLFECNTGECTGTLVDDECKSYPGPVTSLNHRPVSTAHPVTNMIISTYVNGCIKCWKFEHEQCLYTIREKRQTLGLCYHPRFSKFVAYGDDSRLNMYDEEVQTQERSFYNSQRKGIIDGHTSRIFACSYNPMSNHELASGGWDSTVMCWDDRQPYATRYFQGPHLCAEGLAFDKSGRQILTCSWQEKDALQLWDYTSCKLIETIVPDIYQSKLYCGRYIPNTSMIVCGGSDGNIIRVVDLTLKRTECIIRNNPGAVYSIDFGNVRRKRKKANDDRRAVELAHCPRITFVAGKRIQTIDFG